MDALFELEDLGVRNCGTCRHAVQRHGVHSKGTYPLVCLMEACAVMPSYENVPGRSADDWPCRSHYDQFGPYPRKWEAKDAKL